MYQPEQTTDLKVDPEPQGWLCSAGEIWEIWEIPPGCGVAPPLCCVTSSEG